MDKPLYLIRHGKPLFEQDRRVCLGNRLDVGLGAEGEEQARRLRAWFADMDLRIASSRMQRARKTAALIRPDYRVIQVNSAFDEIGMGEWEGCTFDEIRRIYPQLYEMRGKHESLFTPPGGEAYSHAFLRMEEEIRSQRFNRQRTGLVSAHAGVNRLFLSRFMGISMDDMRTIPQEYGCINILLPMADGKWHVLAAGRIPQQVPPPDRWQGYYMKWGTPNRVYSHAMAVRKVALRLTDELLLKGIVLDRGLISAAAALHDMARTVPFHEQEAAGYLKSRGYERLSQVIGSHHDYDVIFGAPPTEEELLFLADKMVYKTDEVDMAERFRQSWVKCVTEEARSCHRRRYRQAMCAKQHMEQYLKRDGNNLRSCV